MAEFTIEETDPQHPDAIVLQAALSKTLEALTGSSGTQSFNHDDVKGDGATFVLARDENGKAVGCVACRPIGNEVVEIKRLFAVPGNRGAGRALLRHIEAFARDYGYREAWLETRSSNPTAVEFYLRNGYRIIENYGRYVGQADAVCFARALREDDHAERA